MRLFFIVITTLLLSFAVAAKTPFTEAAFAQAQAANEVVLIDVFADWCPTCKRQSMVLADYFYKNPASKVKVLVVDFDEQKNWVSFFKAPRQSTLILFKGNKQIWFSVAETKPEVIFKQLSDAEAL